MGQSKMWKLALGSFLAVCLLPDTTVSQGSFPSHCSKYKILNEKDRNINNGGCGRKGGKECYGDNATKNNKQKSPKWVEPGYYRFMAPAGIQMPESAPLDDRCGADAGGWLKGKHPLQYGVEVSMTACFDGAASGDCDYEASITVTRCSHFYVYKLPTAPCYWSNPPNCAIRYCGTNQGAVKLVGGPNKLEGNVYVWEESRQDYGTVCDDYWDSVDASVVCKSLGFRGGVATIMSKYGRVDRGKFVMDDVDCKGNESDLSKCEHQDKNNCWSGEVAGVICFEDQQAQRLVGGPNTAEGNVHVWVEATKSYGSVCDDLWDNVDASVFCRSLGYEYGLATSRSQYGVGDRGDFVMDDVECTGAENDLSSCKHRDTHNCWASEVAGAKCYGDKGSKWIMALLAYRGVSLKLKHLTLPGTHHSGLVDSLSPHETYFVSAVTGAFVGVGSGSPAAGAVANHVISKQIRAAGITQTLTPTQQFESGVRTFDLRFSWDSMDGIRLAHGDNYDWTFGTRPSINGMKWEDFLQQSVNFLNANPSEFFIFGLSWENGDGQWEELVKTLNHPCVQSMFYTGSINDIMSTPVCSLQGKILIRVQEHTTIYKKFQAAGIPSHFPNNIWIGSYGSNYPTQTSKPTEIFSKLITFSKNVVSGNNKLYDVGAICTTSLQNPDLVKLDKACKPGILKYLNTMSTAGKAHVIGVDFATTDLIKRIYKLNKNKIIPTSSSICTIKNQESSCSIKETCQCKYESKREGCMVSRAPNIKNSACNCTLHKKYIPPVEHGMQATYDIFCEGTPVYDASLKVSKGDTSLKACEAGCGDCNGYEVCDCDYSWFKCKVVDPSPPGYTTCNCLMGFLKCHGQSHRSTKHPNCK